MGHDTFQVGDLTAVIGDNQAYPSPSGEHRAGYNGIHRLTHRTDTSPRPETLFVPTVAGMNLEHFFDGHHELQDVKTDRKVFFEPRNSAMTFRRLSDSEAELHQPPTPVFQVESRTRFKLTPPHAIDFDFRCTPRKKISKYGYLGLFWASYINAPDDKSMYFLGEKQWQQLCTPRHNNQSTVRHRDDRLELRFTEGLGDSLYQNLSPLRFDEPFFYGLFRGHVLLLMFDRDDGIRLTHSPSGGGTNIQLQTTNPAWDFQFILPEFEPGKEYGFRGRLVYRERCPRSEIRREFESWRKGLALLRREHPAASV